MADALGDTVTAPTRSNFHLQRIIYHSLSRFNENVILENTRTCIFFSIVMTRDITKKIVSKDQFAHIF